MAMATSAPSLHFLSLAPKTLSLSSPKLSPSSSLSLSSSFKYVSVSPLSSLRATTKPFVFKPSPPSRFVRNVFLEQGEDVSEEEDERQPNFSADLKLFVGNLPFNVDSAALAELFEQAGNVEMVEVIYDKLTGRSRGFGFVTMSSVEEVEAAARQFNGYELQGRPIRVNYGPPPSREDNFRGARGGGGGGTSFDNTNRLYVGNLAYGVDNLALETLFREQGKVLEAKVVYDRESGRSRGFGFVTYSSADEVNSAIESLDGVDLDGRAIRVTVAESRPRRQF